MFTVALNCGGSRFEAAKGAEGAAPRAVMQGQSLCSWLLLLQPQLLRQP